MLDLKYLFAATPRPALGIDIGSTKISLVELTQVNRHRLRLERYAAAALPHGAVRDGQIEQISVVADVLRRVWRSSGARATSVTLGMPPSLVVTRTIRLPAGLSDAELEIELAAEVSQYIPFALEDASFDFEVLGAGSGAAEIEVMLAACHRNHIEDRIAVAEAAGLMVHVIELESCAARAALARATSQHSAPTPVIALCHFGAERMHLTVSQGTLLLYECDHAFGGNELTADLMRSDSLLFDAAETSKKSNLWLAPEQRTLLAAFLERAALAVCHALQLFYTAMQHQRVDQLLFAGGGAALPGLLDVFRRHSPLASAVLSSFAGMALAPSLRTLPADAPAYLVACGLALRRFA